MIVKREPAAPVDRNRRLARQMLLPEIGVEGQNRIAATSASLDVAALGERTLMHRVAICYAERAGFGALGVGDLDEEALAPRSLALHSGPRAVLAGARAAVVAIREAARRA